MIIKRGTVFSTDPATNTARVAYGINSTTQPIRIPEWTKISDGVDVVFIIFEDMTGLILCRADGHKGTEA